jgi:uncharacterized pyridoxal phosphate-containing UPF0001 family protein
VGLIEIATFTENQNQIKKKFEHLKRYFLIIQKEAKESITTCMSMGDVRETTFSNQFGSTMVRVGVVYLAW